MPTFLLYVHIFYGFASAFSTWVMNQGNINRVKISVFMGIKGQDKVLLPCPLNRLYLAYYGLVSVI
jgi:hypothetical protein